MELSVDTGGTAGQSSSLRLPCQARGSSGSFSKVFAGTQVAPEWVGVGQVHDSVDLGLGDNHEVEGFTASLAEVI